MFMYQEMHKQIHYYKQYKKTQVIFVQRVYITVFSIFVSYWCVFYNWMLLQSIK